MLTGNIKPFSWLQDHLPNFREIKDSVKQMPRGVLIRVTLRRSLTAIALPLRRVKGSNP